MPYPKALPQKPTALTDYSVTAQLSKSQISVQRSDKIFLENCMRGKLLGCGSLCSRSRAGCCSCSPPGLLQSSLVSEVQDFPVSPKSHCEVESQNGEGGRHEGLRVQEGGR